MKRKVENLVNMIPIEVIHRKISLIRGHKVLLDRDLAELYRVTTGNLNKTVRRNLERFPEDFMFQLNQKEAESLIFQFGRPKEGRGGSRYLPYAFTEQGVAMLSSVLTSKRAVQVNIQIMRTFSKLREFMITHKDLRQKVEGLEKKYDQQFKVVFEAIKKLVTYPNEAYKKTKIGFIMNH